MIENKTITFLIAVIIIPMVIHTIILTKKKNLHYEIRIFSIGGIGFPPLSVFVWLYTIFAKPRKINYPIKYPCPKPFLSYYIGGIALIIPLLIFSAILSLIISDYFDDKESSEYNYDVTINFVKEMEKDMNITLLNKDFNISSSSFEHLTFQAKAFNIIMEFDPVNSKKLVAEIKKSKYFLLQNLNDTLPSWVQKNDSIYTFSKTIKIENEVDETSASFNIRSGTLKYNLFLTK